MSEQLKKQAAERRQRQKQARETMTKGVVKSREKMREQQIAYNKALAAECDKKGWGKSPASVPEKRSAPLPSLKGSCRRKTGLTIEMVKLAVQKALFGDSPMVAGGGAFA